MFIYLFSLNIVRTDRKMLLGKSLQNMKKKLVENRNELKKTSACEAFLGTHKSGGRGSEASGP